MKLERSRNTKRNIGVGFINKIVTLLLPFAVQTVFIRTLGIEYLGLRGVFNSVLQVLNLAELGFGSAMVFNMYDAIASDNDSLICALLNLYKRIYKYIGLFILSISVLLIPFIPKMISGNYPEDINIYVIYGMYILNTVLSYWLFAYKNSLLNAFQRQDIMGIINTVVQVVLNVVQIVYLVISKNFYIYLGMQIISTMVINIIVSITVDRIFPQYRCVGEVPAEILSKIKEKMIGLMLYKLCGVTRNSFDNIFMSMFLGLVLVGMYNNYYYIITNVMGLLSIITSAMLAGIGNSIASESRAKNLSDMERIDFIYMLLAGWCTVCILCLYQPFMRLWAGANLVFPFPIAVLFTIYFYLLCMGNVRAVYTDAAGLWWENRYRTLLESGMNIVLNYFFVKHWGVYGIIIATIITLFIFGWMGSAFILFKHYFKCGNRKYFALHFIYLAVTTIVCVVTIWVCNYITGNEVVVLVMRSVVCCTVAPALYYLIYFKTMMYQKSMSWLRARIRKT